MKTAIMAPAEEPANLPGSSSNVKQVMWQDDCTVINVSINMFSMSY
jgi:hypothetical protein